jgi:DNA adenine methylase
LNKANELCDRIETTEVTMQSWFAQKEVQQNKKHADLLDLGFSTLFLNRTNRSGIISAGVIGGLEQEGDYKIDCRFNKKDIINRIKLISSKKKSIRLYRKDAVKLIDKITEDAEGATDTIFYFDPPYFLKGSSLYLNHYQESDHQIVSNKIKQIIAGRNNRKILISLFIP